MNILLTNDDGVFAPGIIELGRQLIKRGHNITIFAPDKQNSGKSHAITLMKKLIIKKVHIDELNLDAYRVSGTPADCVRSAFEIYGNKFDYCFSGCNLGYNAGMDILYSGTVSAAVEANAFKIPSIAVSTQYTKDKINFETASKVAIEVFEKVQNSLTEALVININAPNVEYDELQGIKLCKLGDSIIDKYKKVETEDGYELKVYSRNKIINKSDTDRYLLDHGFSTITPLLYNLTNEELLKSFKEFF